MEIVNFGYFTPSADGSIIFYTDEAGNDWYDLRRSLTQWAPDGSFLNAIYGAWATVDADGIVTHVEYDPSRLVPDNRTVLGIDAAPEEIEPGMLYRDGSIVPAPEPTAEELRAKLRPLTPREFRDALIDNNIFPEDVTAAIQEIPDAKARAKALNAWEYPLEFRRDDPLVDQIAASFGMMPEAVDDLWQQATAP